MFVGNPVFPISFQLEQVASLVDEILGKKNWRNFEKGEIKLVLTPFYLFYYDAAFEHKGKPKKETKHGRLALNAETAELSQLMSDAMPPEAELVKELPDSYPLIVRKPIFSKKEAEKVALLKTASLLETERKNIVLTSFEMVYYPIWIAFVTVGGETYELEISAVTGQLFGEEKVPEMEKGFVEITRETLDELKQPGAWLRYSKEIAEITGEKLGGNRETGQSNQIFHKPAFWLTLALLIILIVLMLYL